MQKMAQKQRFLTKIDEKWQKWPDFEEKIVKKAEFG